ncbi:polyprenyl synthetase family protein [Bacillus marinisedimentorum]|uniref:polyprenyl synthetase family protein n=1 Tax=Bacillus marinisedimentorum TaxID=1821260 RepID=UPI0008721366|nr:farnesyl diphosphate synthase [Bacillus marinisedimentorum]
METRLKDYFDKRNIEIGHRLNEWIEELEAPADLKKAMLYSINAGGKRLRPILLFATMEAFGKAEIAGMRTAAAIEMVHTYSLIHDDLPAMDDDDLRRGKPTNHIVFGEAAAILAGDGLLTHSFAVIGEDTGLDAEKKVKLMTGLSIAAGPEGMVGGQAADMEAEGKVLNVAELENVHRNKTGKLLAFAVEAGAIISGATASQLDHFIQFALHLGLAFQIRDDILDIEGDEALIGKPVGSDEANSKNTYPGLLTLDGAKERCRTHLEKSRHHLLQTGTDTSRLEEITNFIGSRTF